MTNALYLRLKSLNTRTMRGVTSPKNVVRVAALHNLRELAAELGTSAAGGINPARMHLNYQLRGPATADDVAGLALALLDNAGVTTLRRDACMALELVVSLPVATTIDHREYFAAAVAWADAYFNVPILSAAVHLDEAAPHCHILLLPLVAGRMQGGALAGGPAKIRAMLTDFQQQVAKRFGLTHQPRTKRLSKPSRDAAGSMVLNALRARPERLSEPAMRDALVAALGSQAETLLSLLGMSMPATKPKTRSFVDIMTAPCKPERAHRAEPETKHIGVAQNLGSAESAEFDNVYVSVDVAPVRDISPPTIQQPNSLAATTDHHTGAHQQTTGQQASSSSLAMQSRPASGVSISDTQCPAPATGQQLERSTTERTDDAVAINHSTAADALSFEDMSTTADEPRMHTAPPSAAGQCASTSPPPGRRAKVKQPVASAVELAAILALQQVDRERAPADAPAPAAADLAAQQQDIDADSGDATTTATAPRKRAPAKRATKPAGTSPAVLASTTRPKRQSKAANSMTATTSSSGTPVSAAPGNPAAQVATTRKRATKSTAITAMAPSTRNKATASSAANDASRKKSELTAAKRRTSVAGKKASAQQQAGAAVVAAKGPRIAQPPGGPSRQNIRGGQQPADHMAGPGHVPENFGAPGHADDVQQMDAIPERSAADTRRASTRRPGQRAAATDSVEAGKSRIDIGTAQPDDIRRLGAGAAGPDQPDEIRPLPPPAAAAAQLGTAPAQPATTTTASAALLSSADQVRIRATGTAHPEGGASFDGRRRYDVRCQPGQHQLPPQGDQHQASSMLALRGDLVQLDGSQRHRDDDRPAELWDEQRGEFASVPPALAKTRCARWPPDEELVRGWCEARPSAIDAALSSILALHGAG